MLDRDDRLLLKQIVQTCRSLEWIPEHCTTHLKVNLLIEFDYYYFFFYITVTLSGTYIHKTLAGQTEALTAREHECW